MTLIDKKTKNIRKISWFLLTLNLLFVYPQALTKSIRKIHTFVFFVTV